MLRKHCCCWPGNKRELKNVVERSVYRHGNSEMELDIYSGAMSSVVSNSNTWRRPRLPLDLRQFQHEQEQQLLSRA
jgi:psp operon transcriptional activator